MALTGLPLAGPVAQSSPVVDVASAASYPAAKPITYELTGNKASDIIGVAKTQTGYTEGRNNNTVFGAWFGCNYQPWCAMFVSWCANKANISTSIVPRLASADRSWYKNNGCYQKSAYRGGDYIPKKGDIIFFSWSGRDYADHVGMVTGTRTSNGTRYVMTIEGNKGNQVKTAEYDENSKYLLGYGTPKYKKQATYKLHYKDGLAATDDDETIIPPDTLTFGKASTITSKKFTRTGYTYTKWHVYREYKDNITYLCVDKDKGTTQKWFKKSEIPDDYKRIQVTSGGKLNIKTKVSGEIRLVPVWTKKKYAIVFDANGGKYAPDTQLKTHGVELTLSDQKPSKYGYLFGGWALKKDAEEPDYQPKDTYSKNKAATLYAVWNETVVRVKTLDELNMRAGPGTKYKIKKVIKKGTIVHVKGIKNGWGKSVRNGYWIYLAYTKDITGIKQKYKVTYNANGGKNAPEAQTKIEYDSLTLSKDAPTRYGYEFKGWAKSATADEAVFQPGDTYKKNAKLTLYAVWKAKTLKMKVKVSKANVRKGPGKKFKLVTTLKKGKVIRIKGIKNGFGRTLKGNWIHLSKLKDITYTDNVYTISYNANGGENAPGAQKKKYGKYVFISENEPVRYGYRFEGWATAPDSDDVVYDTGDKYSKNESVTLYAVWTVRTMKTKVTATKLIMRTGPGSNYSIAKKIKKGTLVYVRGVENGFGQSKKSGYWVNLKYTKDLTPEEYKVKYDADGGKNPPDKQYKKEDVNLKLSSKKPTKYGYEFTGWARKATAKKATWKAGGTYKSNEPVTMHAVWKAKVIKVKVTADQLRMRTGPGLKYKVKKTIDKGTIVYIKGIRNGWGKSTKTGYWIKLSETKVVSAKKTASKKTESKKTESKKASTSGLSGYQFYATVKTDDLVLREGPGTKYDITGEAKEGRKYKIYTRKKGWGKLKSDNWFNLKYANLSGFKVKVTTDELNMRKGPGKKYDSAGYCKPGIYSISRMNVYGTWGKLKKNGYWVKLSYVKRVKN